MYRNDLIKAKMAQLGKRVEDLREETGLSVGTISAIRNGKETVELPNLRAVADALGLTMQELFEPAPEPANA